MGNNEQEYAGRGYDPQTYDPQNYDPQGYAQQGYDPQTYDPQNYDPQGYVQQEYDPQTYDPQNYDSQGYAQQEYDQQTYAQQSYAQQSHDPQEKASPKPSEGSGEATKKTKKKTGLIIGIIAGVVVIAGIIITILLLNKNDDKKKGNNGTGKANIEGGTTSTSGSTSAGTGDATDTATESTTGEVEIVKEPNLLTDDHVLNMYYAPPSGIDKVTMNLYQDIDGNDLYKGMSYELEDGSEINYYNYATGEGIKELGIDVAGLETVSIDGRSFYTYKSGDNIYEICEENGHLYVIYYNPANEGERGVLDDAIASIRFEDANGGLSLTPYIPDLSYTLDPSLPFCGYAMSLEEDSSGNVVKKILGFVYGKSFSEMSYSTAVTMYKNKKVDEVVYDLSTDYEIVTIGDYSFDANKDSDELGTYEYYTQHGDDVYMFKDGGVASSWLYERSDESRAAFEAFLSTIVFTSGTAVAAEIPDAPDQPVDDTVDPDLRGWLPSPNEQKDMSYVPENPILYEDDNIKMEVKNITYITSGRNGHPYYENPYVWDLTITNKTGEDIYWMRGYYIQMNHISNRSDIDFLWDDETVNNVTLKANESLDIKQEFGYGSDYMYLLSDPAYVNFMLTYNLNGANNQIKWVTYYPHGEGAAEDKDDRPDTGNLTPVVDRDGLRIYIVKGAIGYSSDEYTQISFEGYIFNDRDKPVWIGNDEDVKFTLSDGTEASVTSGGFGGGDIQPGCVRYFNLTISVTGDVHEKYVDGISFTIPFKCAEKDYETEQTTQIFEDELSYTSGSLEQ